MRQLLQISLIVIAILLVGEIITRNTIISPKSTIYDPELGWHYKPHTNIFQTAEGWSHIKLNSLGYNDTEISNNKNNVLVLGDSYTEALQVEQNKNFTSLVEQDNKCLSIINAGRSGLSPIQYPIINTRFRELTSIDSVVMILTSGDYNDIISSKKTITIINKNTHWLYKKFNIVLEYSSLATYLKNRLLSLLRTPAPVNKKHTVNQNKEKDNLRKAKEILTYSFNKIKNSSDLYIIYIPKLIFLPDDKVITTDNSLKFENLVAQVSEDNNIPFVSARQFLISSYQEHNQPPVGFPNNNILSGHLNEDGHRSLADALSKALQINCSNKVLPL